MSALWGTPTPLRWDILKVMTGAGPLALGEIARRVGRGVHTGVHSRLAVGLIERDEAEFRFTYDAVHVDFVLNAAWFLACEGFSARTPQQMGAQSCPLDSDKHGEAHGSGMAGAVERRKPCDRR